MSLILLLLGCSDNKLGTFNAEPEAVIISHEPGDVEYEEQTFQLLGRVSDPDDEAANLAASWLVDGEVACEAAPADEEGNTACQLTLPEGEVAVTLLVEDPRGAAGSAQVDLVIQATGTPAVSIRSPADGAAYYAGEVVALVAEATDPEDPTSALELVWSSSVSGALEVALDIDADGSVSGEVALDEGDHTLTLTATDTDGKSSSASVGVVVSPPNTAPSCAVSAPADGASGGEGEDVELVGQVSDPDQAPETLALTWTSDLYGLISDVPAGADGATRVTTSALGTGTHELTLAAADERGLSCSATVLYTVGTPPALTLESPVDGARYLEGEPITFTASVSDGEDAPEELLLSWSSDLDGEFSTQGADDGGRASFTESGLSGGEHTLTVTATDSDGFYARAVSTFTVNRLPGAPVVSITPAEPTTGDDLAVVIDAASVDPDGDAVSYGYTWLRDGVEAGYTGDTLPASATARDQVWTVEVTPYDADGSGSPGEASVTVLNSPPGAPEVSISPADPEPGDALVCVIDVESVDADGDAVDYEILWTVDGAAYGAASSTTWDGDTVPGADTEAEQSWTCTVTPTDGIDEGPSRDATAAVSCEYFTFYEDVDGDGFGDPDTETVACEAPGEGWVEDDRDCDDTLAGGAAINPDATEWCDGVDNDCDGDTDEPNAADALPWYHDGDGDGYGDPTDSSPGCEAPTDYIADSSDCDDGDSGVYPWAGDTYGDGVDRDCDGLDCEAASDGATYFAACLDAVGWHDGRDACQDAGYGDLASVRDAAEQAFLEGLLTDAGGWATRAPWIGYADELVEGYWGWADGSADGYTSWSSGEPSGGSFGEEDCAQLNWPLETGGWNDADCYATEAHQGYFCQLR